MRKERTATSGRALYLRGIWQILGAFPNPPSRSDLRLYKRSIATRGHSSLAALQKRAFHVALQSFMGPALMRRLIAVKVQRITPDFVQE